MVDQEQDLGYSAAKANFALAVFLLAYVLAFVDRQIISLMVDPIRRDLGISDIQIGLLQGAAFSLLYATLSVPFGLLADRTVRKRIIAGGVLFWSVMTAACGLANSYATLFLARMGVGVGEATLSPSAHSFLSDAFQPSRLPRALAIYSMGITIGSGMAYLIGGWVIEAVSGSTLVNVPLVGPLKPWQFAFLVVAAPGAFVAALVWMVKEPPRRGVRSRHSDASPKRALPMVLDYLWINRRTFGPIYFTSSLLAILGYGLASWYPALLIRTYGISAGEAGTYIGLILLIGGSLGAITGGYLSERLATAGFADANLRVVMIVSVGLMVPAIITPLTPTLGLAVGGYAVVMFMHNAYFGASTAAVQLATPNHMRATNAALFLLVNNLVGLALGAAFVPLLGAMLGGEHGGLSGALALIAAVTCPLSAWLARRGLEPYRGLLAAAR